MPKVRKLREEVHQPYWATVIRGTPGSYLPNATLTSPVDLFMSSSTGNVAITNFTGTAAFAGDRVYRILAMRVGLYFRACTGTASYGGTITDHMMYHRAMSQLFWTLFASQKEQVKCTTPYLPLGGGLFGDVGSDTTVYFNNGVPSQEAIAKLARGINLPARQEFSVQCTIAALGAANFVTDVNAVTAGEIDIKFYIDGITTRDVL